MSHTIYTYPHNPRVAIAKIVAKLGGVTNVEEAKDFQMGVTNKTEDFLNNVNPFGKVPALKTASGEGLFESMAIARYFARIGNDAQGLLGGASAIDQSRVDQWIDVSSLELVSQTYPLFLYTWGYGVFDEDKFNGARDHLAKVLSIIEKHLENREYLVTDRITLADITLAAVLLNPVKLALDAEWRKPFPRTIALLERVYTNPAAAEVFGPVNMLEKFEKPN